MKNFIIKNKTVLLVISAILFIYALLWIGSLSFGNPLVFPNPNQILRGFFSLLSESETYLILGSTLFRLVLSTLISFFLAFFLGILAGLWREVEVLLSPLVLIFKSIPVVAIIIIIMSISGFEKTPYVVTVLMIFPLIYQSVIVGVRNLRKEYIEVFKLDSNINWNVVRLVYIPLIKQSIYLGIIQSIGIGIKILVVTEFMVMTKNSIGKALIDEKNSLNFDRVFAYGLLLVFIVILLEQISKKIQKI